MAQKRLRTERVNLLTSRVEALKDASEVDTPRARSLRQKIGEVYEAVGLLEEAHMKFISDEKTTADEKTQAVAEFRTVMRTKDDVVYPAEDKLELLDAAGTLRPEQMINIERERVKNTLASLKDNVEALKTTITGLVSPNKGQLDRLQEKIVLQRTDCDLKMNQVYKFLYKNATSETEVLDLDMKKKDEIKEVMISLDGLDKLILEKTTAPATATPSSASGSSPATPLASSSAYKSYQKPQMPKFDGMIKNYPKWKCCRARALPALVFCLVNGSASG